jgi:hypothetical protein
MSVELNPRYKHDCDGCVLLATIDKYDVYFCENCDEGSLIARYGDEPSNNTSSPVAMIFQRVELDGTSDGKYIMNQAYAVLRDKTPLSRLRRMFALRHILSELSEPAYLDLEVVLPDGFKNSKNYKKDEATAMSRIRLLLGDKHLDMSKVMYPARYAPFKKAMDILLEGT